MIDLSNELDEKWIDVKCMMLDIIDYEEATIDKQTFIKYIKFDIEKLTEKLNQL